MVADQPMPRAYWAHADPCPRGMLGPVPEVAAEMVGEGECRRSSIVAAACWRITTGYMRAGASPRTSRAEHIAGDPGNNIILYYLNIRLISDIISGFPMNYLEIT